MSKPEVRAWIRPLKNGWQYYVRGPDFYEEGSTWSEVGARAVIFDRAGAEGYVSGVDFEIGFKPPLGKWYS